MNHFEKDVYVKIAGVSQPKVLKITGEVLEAKAYDAYVKGGKNEKKVSEPTKVQTGTKAAPVKKSNGSGKG